MPSLLEILYILVEFIPQVFILYFILSVLDNSGILMRFASLLHLPINNVLPLCLTFNCTTMAICATRENPQKNRLVYFLSLIPCTAQIPMLNFLLLSVVKFPIWSIFLLYDICILLGFVILRFIPKQQVDNVEYRKNKLVFPNLRQCLCDTFHQTLLFAKKIFIAFVISAFVIVFFARFSFSFRFVKNYEDSILYAICGLFAPLFMPIGLNHPVLICALFFGIIAKEAAVSVLLFFPNVIQNLTLPIVLSLVIFFTLYPKCLAAQTALSHHCGRKTSRKIFFLNLLLAYSLSFVVYNVCGIFV